MDPQTLAPLIGIAIALPIILLRNRKPRTLRPQWMWVAPVLICLLLAFAIWGMSMQPGAEHAAFGPLDWTVLLLGGLLGAVAGWWRGRMTNIERDADGTLKAQASPIGLVLIVALLLARRALSAWLEPHAASLGLNVLAVTDGFLLFVAAMVVVQRIEMFLRARALQGRAGPPDAA